MNPNDEMIMNEDGLEPVGEDVFVFPTSFAQQRLWFLDQLEAGKSAYNIPEAVRLTGRLDEKTLADSLNEIVKRHETLRTTFSVLDDEPVQVIAPSLVLPLPVVNLRELPEADRESEARRLAIDEARRPFDLERGPLLRACLIRLDEEEYVALITMHHIVSDGWSRGILIQELATLYEAFSAGRPSPLPDLPIQYADFAGWQREWMQGEVFETQLDFWKEQLGGIIPALDLPTDRPRPPHQTFNGASHFFTLPGTLSDELKKLGTRNGATIFMTLLAAFKVFLYKHSGQEDILVGSPVANRNRAEIQGLIGFFVNTLVFRSDLSNDPTFRELLAKVKDVALEAHAHQDLPFERLVEELRPERDMSRSPVFQVMFTLQNAPADALKLPGLTLSPFKMNNDAAKFDLSLLVWEASGGFVASFEYNTDLFARPTIERMAARFQVLLESAVADPDRRISELRALTERERLQILVEWNDTKRDYDLSECIHEMFERQAARIPHEIAVCFEDQTISYIDLNRKANQVAGYLRGLGVEPEAIIGICMERSIEMVVGLLAILKLGGAYLPIDPEYPTQRINYMLDDSGVEILLAQSRLKGALGEYQGRVICLDEDWEVEDWEEIAKQKQGNWRMGLDPDNLAYVIYTSGSTGKPKAAMNTHGAISNRLQWMQEEYRLSEKDRVMQKTPMSFDVSVWEYFWPLMSGARIVMARPGGHRDSRYIKETIRKEGVTVLHFVPSMLQIYLSEEGIEECESVREVMSSGEALSREVVERYYQRMSGELNNLYGPTEAAVDVTYWKCERESKRDVVPIGKAIANTRMYVLGKRMELTPVGVVGEIYIGGAGVGRGYLRKEEMTAEKYVPNPYGGAGERLYRTGDLGRYAEDGSIEYVGRMDAQVKVRGFRVELGEIEAALAEHPAVRESVAIVRDEPGIGKRIIAYVVESRDGQLSTGQVKAHLKNKLPDYMVPGAIIALDAMPLLPNGKIDRRALPAPDKTHSDSQAGYVAPRNMVEDFLVELWSHILRTDLVGIHDNFFDLGGHSLLATQVISRIKKTFGVEIALKSMFEGPTVAAVAESIERQLRAGKGIKEPVISRAARDGELHLSFAQQRLWFMDQLQPGSFFYNMPVAMQLCGLLNAAALEDTFGEILRRHESLRTTFPNVGGRPVQFISPPQPFRLGQIDLCRLPAGEQEREATRLALEESKRPFDLEQGPLFRAGLLRLGEDRHVLLVSMHHIISDGWSMGVLMREVSTIYRSFAAGSESPLAELAVQYVDFAESQREWLQGEALEPQLSYWRQQLGDAPASLELPTDHLRPTVQTYAGSTQPVLLPPDLTGRLKQLARQDGATLFMVLMGAFHTLLYRYTSQRDISVGTPIAGRNRVELEDLIGFFANTLVIRMQLEEGISFRTLLARLREVTLSAYAHQDLPFEKLVEELQPERSLSYSPLFQVMLVLQNTPSDSAPLGDLQLSTLQVEKYASKFDLNLSLSEAAGHIFGDLEYSTSLFEPGTIERMASHLETLLWSVVTDPDRDIDHLAMLTEAERRQILVEWNDTGRELGLDRSAAELFQQQARRRPDAVAVVYGDHRLSYDELNRSANRLAHLLIGKGAGPDRSVALCASRGIEMVLGMLAIIKTGASYLPLDPAYPGQRLAYMLEDSGADLILVDDRARGHLPEHGAEEVSLSRWDELGRYSQDDPEVQVSGSNLGYVIYTSGSTGKPKGIGLPQVALRNLVAWHLEHMPARSRVLQFASMSFDASYHEIMSCWQSGGCLYILDEERRIDTSKMVEYIIEEGVEKAILPVVVLQQTAEEMQRGGIEAKELREVIATGEQLQITAAVEKAFERMDWMRLYNHYGPSESHVVTAYEMGGEPSAWDRHPSIGRPIANTKIYILGRGMEGVPVGVAGELYIGGVCLARGYEGKADLTAEKFVPDPYAEEAGGRLYRTGDVARYRRGGEIEYVGRADEQVKIRGFRVEMGEVEGVMSRYEGVIECVAVARGEGREKRLVGYVVWEEGRAEDVEGLRQHMRKELPEYMVPGAIMSIARMPLTPNGKIDKRALPDLAEVQRQARKEYVAPRTAAEELVAKVFAEVLQIERAGVHDNFFNIGGHSLLATQVIIRLREAFRVDLPLVRLFEYPTVEGLVKAIAEIWGAREIIDEIAWTLMQVEQLSEEDVKLLLSNQDVDAKS